MLMSQTLEVLKTDNYHLLVSAIIFFFLHGITYAIGNLFAHYLYTENMFCIHILSTVLYYLHESHLYGFQYL